MLKNSRKGIPIAVIILMLLNLLLLYFIKYRNQELPLSQFRLYTIGNILNLIFIIILIGEVIIYSVRKNIEYNGIMLLSFAVIISLLLIIASISTIISLPSYGIFIFNHPLNKILIGSFFLMYQFVQIIFIVFLCLNIAQTEYRVFASLTDSIIIIAALLIFAYLYSNIQKTSFNSFNKNIKGNNVAVVLGAAVWSHNKPSPSLEARLEKVIELYKTGAVKHIQLTGSNAPGELSEARVAFNYLLKKGIEPEKIWIEENTTSTAEQIHFIKNELIKRKKIKNIILVSDSYHLVRVDEICRFYNIKVYAEPSDITIGTHNKIYNNVRESIALVVFWLFAL